MPDRLDYSLKSGDGQELVFLYLQFFTGFHNSVPFGKRFCMDNEGTHIGHSLCWILDPRYWIEGYQSFLCDAGTRDPKPANRPTGKRANRQITEHYFDKHIIQSAQFVETKNRKPLQLNRDALTLLLDHGLPLKLGLLFSAHAVYTTLVTL